MEAAAGERRPWEGDIDPFLDEGVGGRSGELSLLLLESALEIPLEAVGLGAERPALAYGEVGQAAEHQGEAPAPSQEGNSPALQCILIGRSIELASSLGLYLCERLVVRRHWQGGVRDAVIIGLAVG